MVSTQAFGDRYVTHRARIGNDMSARLETKSWMLARLSVSIPANFPEADFWPALCLTVQLR
jgi:hypothetical protein